MATPSLGLLVLVGVLVSLPLLGAMYWLVSTLRGGSEHEHDDDEVKRFNGGVINIAQSLSPRVGEWWQRLMGWRYARMRTKGLVKTKGAADVLCLVIYEDEVLGLKRGYYQTDCVGSWPGYRTADGDRFVAYGVGADPFVLDGVPVVICDTLTSSVVHPLKAHLNVLERRGDFERVDEEGQPVDLEAADAQAARAVADGSGQTADTYAWDHVYELADGVAVSLEEARDLVPRKIPNAVLREAEDKARIAESQVGGGSEVLKGVAVGFGLAVLMIIALWAMSTLAGGGGVGINLPV